MSCCLFECINKNLSPTQVFGTANVKDVLIFFDSDSQEYVTITIGSDLMDVP